MSAETFRDRIYHSATFEGRADDSGFPTAEYERYYQEIARNDVNQIITGCTYVSQQGKMVQPHQAGIDSDDKIAFYKRVTAGVHNYDSKIYLQIAHAGRQTNPAVTGKQVVGASDKRSQYFMSKPVRLSVEGIYQIVEAYSQAAFRAQQAGFDGIQIHAAHGYLVHQFLHPYINNRKDEFGIRKDTGIGDLFLKKIITAVRKKCGENFPVLVKISASDDLPLPFSQTDFISLISVLQAEKVHAIEISYGTMEDALNIFRGESIPTDLILKYNFRYKKTNEASRKLWKLLVLPFLKQRLTDFSEHYNLQYAELAKRYTDLPLICVGGFRSGNDILRALDSGKTDYVSLCRPLLCEPDLIRKLSLDGNYRSQCINCNMCAIMCDSGHPTRCYQR